MTDRGPHPDEAPSSATEGCAAPLQELEPDWTDPNVPHMVRAARWISRQPSAVQVLGATGVGRRTTALRLLAATDTVGYGVASELADRRIRDLRDRFYSVVDSLADPRGPDTSTPPAPLPSDRRIPPSSQALSGPPQTHAPDSVEGQLARALQRMSNAELARLGRKIARLRLQIQRALDRLLEIGGYEFLSYVPPHDTSPCGLLRMASPEIPRGPQPGLHLDAPAHPWALAA